MKIAVIGTGYVGLVSGTCFASLGIEVTCVDANAQKISALKQCKIPIYEPGLEELVQRNLDSGRLTFSTDLADSLKGAEAVFIAVGTPPEDDGGADLSYVHTVAKQLATTIDDGTVIVTKSTVPVGTGDQIRKIISQENPDLTFYMASNPEFLREGCAVDDFLDPDRVLVGVEKPEARSVMEELYRPLSDRNIVVIFTDIKTAELTKYTSNAFLATKIAFVNEIADLCEKADANIEHLTRAMGIDNRIGSEYLKPGPGFGGSCFPKDTLALRKISNDLGCNNLIVEAVIRSNEQRKAHMAQKIITACGGNVNGKTIAIMGVAFKANTDDVRESAAMYMIPELIENGAKINAYDPQAMGQAKLLLKNNTINWCDSYKETMQGADAVVIVTEWDEFQDISFINDLQSILDKPVLVDLRNLYTRQQMLRRGIDYHSIGRLPLYGHE